MFRKEVFFMFFFTAKKMPRKQSNNECEKGSNIILQNITTMALPLAYDPATKLISSDSIDETLQVSITDINRLTRDLASITSDIPQSPEPSPQLTPMIKKLITSGVESLKQQKLPEAIKQLSLAIDMAGRRARWEAFGIQLQELNAVLQIRCDAYLLNQQYMEALQDAEILIGTQVLTADNFLRKAICLLNLGRFEESRVEFERGLCFHPDNQRMKDHLKLVEKAIALENGEEMSQ